MTTLSITFLGTGTSVGVPVVGCDCAVCTSADPRDKRLRASIYVETPEAAWVVDTGPDFRTQCLREKIHALDAVFYTHSHTDHVCGFDDLRVFCARSSLPIYATESTMNDLRRMFAFAFEREHWSPGYIRPEPFVISETESFRLGETVITPLPAQHGRFRVLGFLFSRGGKKLAAYLSDCKEIPAATLEKMRGVECLIIDALRHREHPSHMTVSEAMAVSEKVQPRQTWFTHICHELGHAATEAALPPNIRLACDGLQIKL